MKLTFLISDINIVILWVKIRNRIKSRNYVCCRVNISTSILATLSKNDVDRNLYQN